MEDKLNAILLQLLMFTNMEYDNGDKVLLPDELLDLIEEMRLALIDARDNGSDYDQVAMIVEGEEFNRVLMDQLQPQEPAKGGAS